MSDAILNLVIILTMIFMLVFLLSATYMLYQALSKKPNGRKFKLIKLYPGSPDVGTIVNEKMNGQFDDNFKQAFRLEFLEKWPNFWEEIK